MPRLANTASLAAFGSLAGVAWHMIVYVLLLLGLVQPVSAGQPFPTTLPTETRNLDIYEKDYTGTFPTQVSGGRGLLFHVDVNTSNKVKLYLKNYDSRGMCLCFAICFLTTSKLPGICTRLGC